MIAEDRKKRVLDLYFKKGKTLREIIKIERMSLADASDVVKEARGEQVSQRNRKKRDYSEYYAAMYRLFEQKKRPLEVAILLNLPIDYVNEEYVKFLDCSDTPGFAKLYQKYGYDGFKRLQLIDESLQRVGKNPKSAAEHVDKAEELVNLGYTYDILSTQVNLLSKGEDTVSRNLQYLKNCISDETAKLKRLKRDVEGFQNLITKLKKDNPEATAVEAARASIKDILKNYRIVFELEIELLLQQVKNDPMLTSYIEWYLFPNRRRYNFSDRQIMDYIKQSLPAVTKNIHEFLVNDAMNRASIA